MFEPKLYSKYNDCQREGNLLVLDEFLRLIKWNSHDSVLDVGCGDGKFSVESLVPRLPKTFRKFVGCDISEAMVKFAKATYKQPKVDFEQLDISSENIPSHLQMEFNHIFSFYTLQWVAAHRQALTNMYNMLKPGGDILLTFSVNNPIYDIYLIMSNNTKWQSYTMLRYGSPCYGCQGPQKTLENILTDIGFESHVCRIEKKIFRYPSREVFEKSIVAVNPLISELPPEQVSDYVVEFMQHMNKLKCISVETNLQNEEIVNLEFQVFVIYASKPADKL